ncbi:hypothetical protein [Pseudomonas oryzihabitans]|uniref:hypothetical protein n=1 Tax=Pseudomonas oryzihabitans TaxID=47885 RepID=UPI0011AB20DC|nr:hypothetical protein [Pseudomonas psychrotolerans]
MKSAIFRLDRQLYELLTDERCQQFTIRSLRDFYAIRTGVQANGLDLWRYIYDQVRRLVRMGWVSQDSHKRRRDQIFHVTSMPPGITLVLIDPKAATTDTDSAVDRSVARTHTRQRPNNTTEHLELLAKEIRLDMLTAMGEAERYKQLFTEIPALKTQIESDYFEARDRSSKLLGHLRAIEKTLNILIVP